jgi:hypothetical protein
MWRKYPTKEEKMVTINAGDTVILAIVEPVHDLTAVAEGVVQGVETGVAEGGTRFVNALRLHYFGSTFNIASPFSPYDGYSTKWSVIAVNGTKVN